RQWRNFDRRWRDHEQWSVRFAARRASRWPYRFREQWHCRSYDGRCIQSAELHEQRHDHRFIGRKSEDCGSGRIDIYHHDRFVHRAYVSTAKIDDYTCGCELQRRWRGETRQYRHCIDIYRFNRHRHCLFLSHRSRSVSNKSLSDAYLAGHYNRQMRRLALSVALSILAGVATNAQTPIVLEAEAYTQNLSPRSSHDWSFSNITSGFSGLGYMEATPNNGANIAAGSNSPELQFTANFANSGTHYIWIRGYGASVN